jgi:Insertion element 4 transposase N-terminal
MAGKPARRLNGIRISDFVSLGVLTTTLPPPLIDEVLTASGRHSRRQRQLPAQLVIYYVIALALYGPVSCSEVLRCLIEGLRWLRRGAYSGRLQIGHHPGPHPAGAGTVAPALCRGGAALGPAGHARGLVSWAAPGQHRRHHD